MKVLILENYEEVIRNTYLNRGGGSISSPNSYTDAIVSPLILGLVGSLQYPFWVPTQSSWWTAAFVLSRREIYHLQYWYWCFLVFPPATHLPVKECSSCCSNLCQSAICCSSGKWVTKMRENNNKLSLSLRRFKSLLSYNFSRRECDREFLNGRYRRLLQCWNSSSLFDCGAQGVHKGSVWTEAVLRKFMEKLEVVAFRSIAPQEILVSWRSTEGPFEEEGMSHHVK